MAHSVMLVHRFVAPVDTLDLVRQHMSPPHRASWLRGGKQKILVGTWLGVPGKLGDVAIPATGQADGALLVVDISQKTGCYDGAVRWRVTLRWWTAPKALLRPPSGRLLVESHGDDELAIIATWAGGGFWNLSLPRLAYTVCQATDPAGIVFRQAKDYFAHLALDDVRPIANSFTADVPDWRARDINELNRLASRLLYAQSRALGWRKLTLQEKRRHGISADAPQWVRADDPRLRGGMGGNPSGCGQYTIDAASGRQIRTPYGVVEEE